MKTKAELIEELGNIERKKPHFFIIDLDNYNESFLIEIVIWQNEKIKLLGEIIKQEVGTLADNSPLLEKGKLDNFVHPLSTECKGENTKIKGDGK